MEKNLLTTALFVTLFLINPAASAEQPESAAPAEPATPGAETSIDPGQPETPPMPTEPPIPEAGEETEQGQPETPPAPPVPQSAEEIEPVKPETPPAPPESVLSEPGETPGQEPLEAAPAEPQKPATPTEAPKQTVAAPAVKAEPLGSQLAGQVMENAVVILIALAMVGMIFWSIRQSKSQ